MNNWNKIVLALCFLSFISCNNEDTIKEKKNKADMVGVLTNYADKLIIPAYSNFGTKLTTLETLAANYSAANHDKLKVALDSAYMSWQACAMYDFGPASNYSLHLNTNVFPTDTSTIGTNIESNISDISASTLAPSKGLGALDYLLYTRASLNAKELAYVRLVIEDLNWRTKNTIADWKNTYINTFKANTGYDAGSSICFLTNAYIKYLEREYRHGKVGIPVGVLTSNTAQASKVEAFYSQKSTNYLQESTKQLIKCYYGNGGLGMDYLIKSDDSSMDDQTIAAIDNGWIDIQQKTDTIYVPINKYVIDNHTNAQTLYNTIQNQLVLLKIDYIYSLSLTIKYIDTDGD